jgi:hypothetical protein
MSGTGIWKIIPLIMRNCQRNTTAPALRRGIPKQGAIIMNIAAVLRVFKNSSLITERGEFKISRVFDNGGAARKAWYHYHCTEKGIIIYARRNKTGRSLFAVVDR